MDNLGLLIAHVQEANVDNLGLIIAQVQFQNDLWKTLGGVAPTRHLF